MILRGKIIYTGRVKADVPSRNKVMVLGGITFPLRERNPRFLMVSDTSFKVCPDWYSLNISLTTGASCLSATKYPSLSMEYPSGNRPPLYLPLSTFSETQVCYLS
jgi:hypothetical protein